MRQNSRISLASHVALALVGLVGVSSPPTAAAATYSVGVLSADGTCPPGSELVTNTMDVEDAPHDGNFASPMGAHVRDSYGTWTVGWIGAITASFGGGAKFTWCKVEGTQFKPLTTTYDPNYHYAVLKLGTTCPPGSDEFGRYFDNEDNDNRGLYYPSINDSTGDISPNVVTMNTQLYFCLFRHGPVTMGRPPSLGGPYGLLARHHRGPEKFPFAVDSGLLHTDEEDSFNSSKLTAPWDIDGDARRVVEPFRDGLNASGTYFHLVKVDPAPPVPAAIIHVITSLIQD